VISGGLAQRALGSSVFAWWSSQLYTEAGIYWTPGRRFLSTLGVDINDGGDVINGGAPYFRVAYQKDYGDQNFEIGGFGLLSRLYPGGIKDAGSDRFSDLGIDASWQLIGKGDDFYQINTRYTHEAQNRDASSLLGASENMHDTLQELHLDFSYYWQQNAGRDGQPLQHLGIKGRASLRRQSDRDTRQHGSHFPAGLYALGHGHLAARATLQCAYRDAIHRLHTIQWRREKL
jgi:hypothetical protein